MLYIRKMWFCCQNNLLAEIKLIWKFKKKREKEMKSQPSKDFYFYRQANQQKLEDKLKNVPISDTRKGSISELFSKLEGAFLHLLLIVLIKFLPQCYCEVVLPVSYDSCNETGGSQECQLFEPESSDFSTLCIFHK